MIDLWNHKINPYAFDAYHIEFPNKNNNCYETLSFSSLNFKHQ